MAAESLLASGDLRVDPVHHLVVVQRLPAKHIYLAVSRLSPSICHVLFL